MEQVLQDNRAAQRYRISLYVYDISSGKLLGRTDNISVNGMMMLTQSKITAKSEYAVLLQDPADKSGEKVVLRAYAVWTSMSDSKPVFYYSGFSFIAPSAESVAAIESLIEKYADS